MTSIKEVLIECRNSASMARQHRQQLDINGGAKLPGIPGAS
jgi:hypothetical protein